MADNHRLEDLGWNDLTETIGHFITADGPNTDDLPVADFFALWSQFDGERKHPGNLAYDQHNLSF